MYAHPRPTVSVAGRIAEHMDNLKSDFDTVISEHSMFKAQRDDLERKVNNQVSELSTIQQTIYELQQAHTKIKAQYEEEILRLRRQLEMGGGPPATYSSISAPIPSLHMPGVGTPPAPSPTASQSRAPPTGLPLATPEKSGIMAGSGPGMFYNMPPDKRSGAFQPAAPAPTKRPREDAYPYSLPEPVEEKFTPKTRAPEVPEIKEDRARRKIPPTAPVVGVLQTHPRGRTVSTGSSVTILAYRRI